METATPLKGAFLTTKRSTTTTTRRSVASKDGTVVGYRVVVAAAAPEPGAGSEAERERRPSVVLVQGSFGTADHFDELSRLLAADFTVVIPDRRGRGMTPCAFTDEYGAAKEVEDLDAVANAVDASFVFGLSSGGIVALEAALALQRIKRVAVFEPPFLFGDFASTKVQVDRFQSEMRTGRVAAGMVSAMRMAQFAPWWINCLPRPLLEALTWVALKLDSKPGPSRRYPPLRDLALSTRFDFALVYDASVAGIDKYKNIKTSLLLLGGDRSPAYLKESLGALHAVVPEASKTEIAGVGHGASWNHDRGGKPEAVAPVLSKFFLEMDR